MPQLIETAGEIARGAALPDMRVPAAHVHEADVVALGHQPGDAPRLQLEALGRDGLPAGRFHLAADMSRITSSRTMKPSLTC
ncbi:MAG: hypothetical protein QM749_11010 [Aquabacterium sp.]